MNNGRRGKALDVTSNRAANADIAAKTLEFLSQSKLRFAPQVEAGVLYNEEQLNEPAAERPAGNAPEKKLGIEVTDETTLLALHRLTRGNKDAVAPRVCVLNFASAKSIGGGFRKGSSAQEESLARSSSLYPCLEKFKKPFYEYNKTMPGVYSDRIIFSPEVSFFKNDRGKALPEVVCAVVTAPAVNAGVSKCDAEEVRRRMEVRMRKILRVAMLHGLRVLILGAFGCGVFKNSPAVVAAIWRELLDSDEFRGCFDRVVFACYGPKENLDEFVRVFP